MSAALPSIKATGVPARKAQKPPKNRLDRTRGGFPLRPASNGWSLAARPAARLHDARGPIAYASVRDPGAPPVRRRARMDSCDLAFHVHEVLDLRDLQRCTGLRRSLWNSYPFEVSNEEWGWPAVPIDRKGLVAEGIDDHQGDQFFRKLVGTVVVGTSR